MSRPLLVSVVAFAVACVAAGAADARGRHRPPHAAAHPSGHAAQHGHGAAADPTSSIDGAGREKGSVSSLGLPSDATMTEIYGSGLVNPGKSGDKNPNAQPNSKHDNPRY